MDMASRGAAMVGRAGVAVPTGTVYLIMETNGTDIETITRVITDYDEAARYLTHRKGTSIRPMPTFNTADAALNYSPDEAKAAALAKLNPQDLYALGLFHLLDKPAKRDSEMCV